MRSWVICLCLLPFLSEAQDKESFRAFLAGVIQQDPVFKEVELQTPFYESQMKQGLSKLILPRVGLQYGYYEQHNNLNLTSAGSQYRYGGLNASFNLFSFGRDLNIYRAGRAERSGQEQKVLAQLLTREREVGLLVLDYLKDLRNLDILRRLVALKEKSLSVSKRRFERGALSEQDYSKVKIDVSNARAELLVAEQAFNQRLARVRAYGVESLPEDYPWKNELTRLRIEELLQTNAMVEELPQFQEAALAEEASDYRMRAARGAMLGSVQLNFSRSYYAFDSQNQWEWRTSLVYTLPLFDQFDQYADFKRNDVLQRSNEVRKRFQLRQSKSNQEAENLNLEVSWKNWIERRDALAITSKLYDNSLGQFNQGQLSVNELFVDQDRLLRTEQIANFALHQLHGTVLAFCHSRGKAFIRGCF